MITRDAIRKKSSDQLIDYLKSLPKEEVAKFVAADKKSYMDRFELISNLFLWRHPAEVFITIFEIVGKETVDIALTSNNWINILNNIIKYSQFYPVGELNKIEAYFVQNHPEKSCDAMVAGDSCYSSALYFLAACRDYNRLLAWRHRIPLHKFLAGVCKNGVSEPLLNHCKEDATIYRIISDAIDDYKKLDIKEDYLLYLQLNKDWEIDKKLNENGKQFLTDMIKKNGIDAINTIFQKATPAVLKAVLLANIQYFLTNYEFQLVRKKFLDKYITYAEEGNYTVAYALYNPTQLIDNAQAKDLILNLNSISYFFYCPSLFTYLKGRTLHFTQRNLIDAYNYYFKTKELICINSSENREISVLIWRRLQAQFIQLGHEFLADRNTKYAHRCYSAAEVEDPNLPLNMATAQAAKGRVDIAAMHYLEVCVWGENLDLIEGSLEKFRKLPANKSAHPELFSWLQKVYVGETLQRKIHYYSNQKNSAEVMRELENVAANGSISALKVLLSTLLFRKNDEFPNNEELSKVAEYFEKMCILSRQANSFVIPASMKQFKVFVAPYLIKNEIDIFKDYLLTYINKAFIDDEIKKKIATILVNNIELTRAEVSVLKDRHPKAKLQYDKHPLTVTSNFFSNLASSVSGLFVSTPAPAKPIAIEMTDRHGYISFEDYTNRQKSF